MINGRKQRFLLNNAPPSREPVLMLDTNLLTYVIIESAIPSSTGTRRSRASAIAAFHIRERMARAEWDAPPPFSDACHSSRSISL